MGHHPQQAIGISAPGHAHGATASTIEHWSVARAVCKVAIRLQLRVGFATHSRYECLVTESGALALLTGSGRL